MAVRGDAGCVFGPDKQPTNVETVHAVQEALEGNLWTRCDS